MDGYIPSLCQMWVPVTCFLDTWHGSRDISPNNTVVRSVDSDYLGFNAGLTTLCFEEFVSLSVE